MTWKKFIVSVCCLVLGTSAYACVYWPPVIDEMYMFKTYCQIYDCTYTDEVNFQRANVDFWYNYVNAEVDRSAVDKALYNSSKEDIYNGKYLFFRCLQQNNDTDALRYWELTKRFAEYNSDPWYYPTKADMLELRQLAQKIQSAGELCANPLLKERYAMQLLRICFYLKDYVLCCDVWEKHSGGWKDQTMEKKSRSYYAGALFHLGRRVEAADHFAELEEWESLRYFGDNVDFMREVYKDKPCSKAFEFLIQNFENRYQDDGNLLDSKGFVELCEQVLKEKRTDNPALWQSAAAHIAFLDGDVKKAVGMIEKAFNMKGTPMVMENVRMLRLLYHAADTDVDKYDEKINEDFPWMLKKLYDLDDYWAENSNGEHHYLNMTRRILFKHLIPQYAAQGNSNMQLALLNAFDEAYCLNKETRDMLRNDKNAEGSYDYNTFSFAFMDTASIENVMQFLSFVKSGGKTALEKNLIKAGYVRESMIYELLGTKYMRMHDYETALQYFYKVNSFYWNKMNITEYLERNPFEEKWFERQVEKGMSVQQYDPAQLYAANPTKIQFCLIMNELKSMANSAPNEEQRAFCHYAYAVGLEQSHNWSWALTQYVSGDDYWDGVFYQLETEVYDNGWDYLRSKVYSTQVIYKEISKHLDKAEKLSKNRELIARCQYMRSHVELDDSRKQQYRYHLTKDFTDTKFHSNEMIHCDYLSMYR